MVGTPATISSDFTCIVEEVINAAFRLNRILFLAGNCYKCIKASHSRDICCGAEEMCVSRTFRHQLHHSVSIY